MVTACQTCGDIGFPNALIICDKCRKSAQHRYCSEKLTFTEDITWFCEDCIPTPALKYTRVVLRKSIRMEKQRIRAIKAKKRLQRKSNGDTCLVNQKEQQRCGSPPLLSHKVYTKVGLTESVHTTADVVDCSLLDDGNNDKSCENLAEAQDHGIPQRLRQENQCNSIVEAKSTKIKDSEIEIGASLDILDNCSLIPAQPIIDPIWRGQFDICNKTPKDIDFGIVEGLTAHLSNKACLKVSEEASLLPAFLFPDMLLRSDVWPRSFEISQPCDDNIALYFFPGNPRDEEVYSRLVDDMVKEELAMKAVLENAELLVFASTELPLRYWKFQGKNFLWGVFRGKQASSCHESREPSSLQNGYDERIAVLNVVNGLGVGEVGKLVREAKTWNSRSPSSPFSNTGSGGSGEHDLGMDLSGD